MVVISHAYKFVFIKTSKTGGTAIETCLSDILPASDILTPIFPDEGEGHVPRNYKCDKGIFYNHMPAREVIRMLGHDCKDYFYWCVEREPIDKCISHYAMLKNSPDHGKDLGDMTWEEYLKGKKLPIDSGKYYSRRQRLSFKKEILVDHIVDYHNIREQLPIFLREKFGINGFDLNNSNAKGGYRNKKNILTSKEVTQEQRDFIYNRFRVSIQVCRELGITYTASRR